MMRKLLTILSLVVSPAAFALNSRSAVSINGLDTNPCTAASPCRSLGVAELATAAGGEIVALTTAGYGPFTIDRSITVSGAPGIHAAITSSSNGITISAGAADDVTIRNLVLIGTATSVYGILENSAAQVRLIHCLIRGFQSSGIIANSGKLTVEHCVVIDNLGHGIEIDNAVPDTTTTRATIADSVVELSQIGILCSRGSSTVVSNSSIWRNQANVYVVSVGGATSVTTSAVIEKCIIAQGSYDGIYMATDGTNVSNAWISNTLFEGNNFSLSDQQGGTAYTFGNNRFVNNSNAPDAMTPASLQ